MPRTAYLIPGRGGKWGGWRRDVRRRFRRRRFRSPGWVAAGGRATHPAGWLTVGHSPCPEKIFDSENPGSAKKTVNGLPLIIFWGLGVS